MSLYEGEFPVDDEWVESHMQDDSVSFRYVMTLEDLIFCDGMEGMNDYMDSVLSMRKAVLTDIDYIFVEADDWDELGNSVLIQATGVLEEF